MFDFLFNTLNWREPLWIIIALQPLLLWLILRWYQNKNQQQFADAHLLPYLLPHLQANKQSLLWSHFLSLLFSRNTAYVLAWILFALSLAGPRLPDKPNNKQNEIVLDVMMVVDLSQSMLSTDIKPSRLRRATLEAFDFLSFAKNIRVGITVYAARSHLFVPLTSDFKALRFYLESLDTLQLPTLGGNANAALSFATKELLDTESKHKQVILWLTDGDIEPQKVDEINNTLKTSVASNISTYILGLGTIEGGAIPLNNGNWLESEGQAVITKMNSAVLQQFADTGNGYFTSVTHDDADWQALYQQGMLSSLVSPEDTDTQQWKELFPWVLSPAILLLLIALFPVSLPRVKAQKSLSSLSVGFVSTVFIAIVVASISPPIYAQELNYQSSVSKGIEAYTHKEFALSKHEFIQSVLSSKNDKERGLALHNLGNALFQSGDYSSAAEVFTDALRYAPHQKETIENQKLSIQIFTLIEKRKKRLGNQGNFFNPNDDSPLFDLPDQIPFMLSSKAVMLLKASLPDLPEGELERLLSKEMQQFQLMQGEQTQNVEQQKQQQDMAQARIHFMGLEEAPSHDLWKRLFEIEEGFPAKLKQAKTLPGVQPW